MAAKKKKKPTAKKNPVGRPTKYKPEYCNQIKEFMSDGASLEEFAAEIGVVFSTIWEWEKKFPEFSKAKCAGEELSKAWWLRQGRINLHSETFNHALWGINMKNRHDWRDKKDIEQKTKLEATTFSIHHTTNDEYERLRKEQDKGK